MSRLGTALLLLLSGCATVAARQTDDLSEPGPSTPKSPPSRRSVMRSALAQTIKLHVYDGKNVVRAASAVVVGMEETPRGVHSFVVTSAHVLDPLELEAPRYTVVVDLSGEQVELVADPLVLGDVPEMDLALVRIRGARLEPALLAEDAELEAGESVVVAAAPYGKGMSLSGGMISRVDLHSRTHLPEMVKTDAPIAYGASGGGIFSLATGRLVAVVEGYRTAKLGFEIAERTYTLDLPVPGETFGAPSAKVRTFLLRHGFARLLAAPGADPRALQAQRQ